MTSAGLVARSSPQRALRLLVAARDWLRAAAWAPLVQLLLRIALAVPFWKSGILKWSGFLQLNDTAVTLFSDNFQLHLPGGPYAYPAPMATAFAAACCEVALPVLLVLGLGTRFAAAALLAMTFVIQLTVPDGWPLHVTWAAMALAIVAYGAGPLSLDRVLERRWAAAPAPAR